MWSISRDITLVIIGDNPLYRYSLKLDKQTEVNIVSYTELYICFSYFQNFFTVFMLFTDINETLTGVRTMIVKSTKFR